MIHIFFLIYYFNRNFKESCGSMEIFNNREREYLDIITELKSKLITSEKIISRQETVITNLNEKLSKLSNKNQVCIKSQNVIRKYTLKCFF